MMRLTPAFREKILLNFSFILSVFLKNRVALQLVQQKPSLIMVEYWKMKLKKTDILSSVTGFSYNVEHPEPAASYVLPVQFYHIHRWRRKGNRLKCLVSPDLNGRIGMAVMVAQLFRQCQGTFVMCVPAWIQIPLQTL